MKKECQFNSLTPEELDKVYIGAYPERAPDAPCIPNGIYMDHIRLELPVVITLNYGRIMHELKEGCGLVMAEDVFAKLRMVFEEDRRYDGYHLAVMDHCGFPWVSLERNPVEAEE